MSKEPPVIKVLNEATEGLFFRSETDARLEPFFWPAEATSIPTADLVIQLINAPAGAPLKSVTLATFFRPATKNEEWHNEEEKAEVQRFQDLVKTIKSTLKNVKVFRIGETNLDVYIVGIVEGGYAGLKTNVVET